MFGRPDALLRLLLKRIYDPDLIRELDRVHDAKRIAAERERDFENARAEAMKRFRDIGFGASAAMVSAASIADCASFGKSSKSLRAALIQEVGRVFLAPTILFMLSVVTTACQPSGLRCLIASGSGVVTQGRILRGAGAIEIEILKNEPN